VGFMISIDQAAELIAEDSRNSDVLQPFLIGRDLNQRPDCSPSRWVINFHDWPLERAKQYPRCLEIVRRFVKPFRERSNQRAYRELWWQYGSRGVGLYEAIAGFQHVLAISRVGNVVMPVRVATGPVFSEATAVFALDDYASLAALSSSSHFVWTARYTS